ncbi:MAG: hypothetical protein HGA45_23195 [Chloroflexales bacterium]|nr:hypothetical protein [Chloroflexales bacterium]
MPTLDPIRSWAAVIVGAAALGLGGCGQSVVRVDLAPTATAAPATSTPRATPTTAPSPSPSAPPASPTATATSSPTPGAQGATTRPLPTATGAAPAPRPTTAQGAPPEGSSAGQAPPELLAELVADLAARTGAPADAIVEVASEAVEWPDSSLGCPQPGQSYLQVITPGYRVLLQSGDTVYDYRAAERGFFFLCAPKP